MYIKTSIFPQANIYSSKTLFDNLENRNQKRKAQIMKRKKLLTSKNKNTNLNATTKDKSSEQMITQSTQEASTNGNNNLFNLSKSDIRQDKYYNKILCDSRSKTIERFLSSFKNDNKNTEPICLNHNLNINNENLAEKEVNISNLNDNESNLEIYNFNEKNNDKDMDKAKSQNKRIILNDKLSNEFNLKRINKNENVNQRKILYQGNKYAIEFLSSSLDSFVEFKNKLVTKAKYDKNYFTLSYSQALFSDYYNLENKKFGGDKMNDYEVNEIIKEENESCSPNDKYFLEQPIKVNCPKKNDKKSKRKSNIKMPNKSFSKTVENKYVGNLLKGYSFNKNSMINNYKLKIPKCKLSLELKNIKKTYENKVSHNLLEVNNKKNKSIKNNILSPKFTKLKEYLDQIKMKESFKNSKKKNLKKLEKK